MAETSSPIVTLTGQSSIERWKVEIDYARQETKKFHERARRVVTRFLDERDSNDANHKWFNLFYANVHILESALYAQLPKPSVARAHLDYKDDVSRVAAEIIQRCIMQDLDDPLDFFDSMMRQCVQDRLVPGLAQAWLRLETETEDIEGSSLPPTPFLDEAEDKAIEVEAAASGPLQRITKQRVEIGRAHV